VAVARDEIVNALGHSLDAYDFRRLEVAIRRLRKKLESSDLVALPLETVYGMGYVLNAELKVL
jgi:DNA-binding response OmpR family regulator